MHMYFWTRIIIGLMIGITGSLRITGQALEFYREDILFSIHENYVITDAEYFFCNVEAKDIRTTLFYPFPGNTMELIDSIEVKNLKTNAAIPFRKARSGIFFEIFAEAYGQSAYRVLFRQRLHENHFKYILRSTETWGRSLEIANYELQLTDALILDSLSYPPDTFFILNDLHYYQWKKTDFMPEKDFEIFFHSK